MSYEAEQKRLERLLQEALSEEDDSGSLYGDVYLSHGFQGNSDAYSSDSKDSVTPPRKVLRNKNCKRAVVEYYTDLPSTSSCGVNNCNSNSVPSTSYHQESTSVTDTIEEVVQAFVVDSSNSDDNSSDEEALQHATNDVDIQWGPVTGINMKSFPFSENNCGFSAAFHETYYDKEPYDFYLVFLNDDVLDLMVTETNRYADQCLAKNAFLKSRVASWYQTTREEMKKLIGIIMWMGLCYFPTMQSYWSKSVIYNNYIKTIISRNRFQLLLKMMHFHDNSVDSDDRLQKIRPLLEIIKTSFQRIVTPGEHLCIDETLVPFRGRLTFKQYISNKRHKFGVKLFKLCLEKGYTYDFDVYCGKSNSEGKSVATKVVLDLSKDLLNKGRTICTDNWYTSVPLAHTLLQNKTHLIGTLKRNRKFTPKDVVNRKLEVGEAASAESNTEVVVEKWKDRRDVLMLSTKHTNEMVTVQRRGSEIKKPRNVTEYNKYKSYIDFSDQMKSYNTSLRKSLKWYRQLAVEFLTGSCLVNAFAAHQQVANERMSITKFREEVIRGLLNCAETVHRQSAEPQHKLEDLGRTGRRKCTCYAKTSRELGRKEAQKKAPQTKFKCDACNKSYCLKCFFDTHKVTV